MADDISVQLQADISDFLSAMDSVADKVDETMDKVGAASEEAGERLDAGIGDGAEKAKEKVQSLGDETEGLGNIFEDIKDKMQSAFEATGILLAYEAVMKVADALGEMMHEATNIANMSDAIGISTNEFQALSLAAEEAGVSMTRIQMAAIRFSIILDQSHAGVTTATDKLYKLGLTTDEVNDKTLNISTMLEIVADRLRDSTTAELENAAVKQVLSARIAGQVIPALKNYHGSQEEIARGSIEQNAIDQEQIGTLQKLQKAWADLTDKAKNTSTGFVADVVKMENETNSLSNVFDRLVSTIVPGGDAILAAIHKMTDAKDISGSFDAAGIAAAEAMNKIATASAAAAVAEQKATHDTEMAAIESAKRKVEFSKEGTEARYMAEAELAGALNTVYGSNDATYKKTLDSEEKAFIAFNEKTAEDASKAATAQLREIERVDRYKTESAKKAVAEYEKSSNELLAIITKEKDEEAKAAEKSAITQLESAKVVLDAQMKNKQISPDTYLTAEIVLINEHRDAVIAAAKAEEAAHEGTKDAVEKEVAAEQAANDTAMKQITAANVKAAQDTKTAWQAVTTPIESAFTSALDGMLKHTETFRSAVKKTFDSLTIDVINGAIHKMLTEWLSAEAAKIAASQGGAAVLKALGMSNLVTAKATDTTMATSDITTKAAQAAAGAFAATAAIPYVGPELAPAAAAEAEASVMAFLAQATAAQGGIVNKDMPVSLHQDEMILPPHISKGIQETLGSFAQGASGGAGGGSGDNNNFHIHAHDSASFEKFLNKQSNRNTVMKAMNKAMSRGNRNIAGLGNRGTM